jgi:ABC-type amino acid transport substrate-binding protein
MPRQLLPLIAAAFFVVGCPSSKGVQNDLVSSSDHETLPTAITGKKLRVGIYLNQPFGYEDKGGYSGFCVDLWKEIAADLSIPCEYVSFAELNDLLMATSRGNIDIALGNISITGERLKSVDFSQPFLQGGLQIMVDERRSDSWYKLWLGLKESGHIKILSFAIAIILLLTILMTVGERQWNEEFHKDWPNGLAESFYHVMSVTMTGKSTHKPLPGPLGKILAGIWLAFGVAVVAYITSSVTSVMTVNRLHGIINGAQDLPGHHVGAIEGTLSQKYCDEQNLNTTLYSNLPEAVKALVGRKIDAIVFDAMTLQWYDNAHPELPITEVGPIFLKKGYGFALPIGSKLRHPINRSLLKQQESGFVETLRKHYFGDIQ